MTAAAGKACLQVCFTARTAAQNFISVRQKPETESGILSLRQLQFRTRNMQNLLHPQRGAGENYSEAVSSLADYVRCYEQCFIFPRYAE
ncbi:MAG: hypothetical protein ACLUI6_03155 [Butyricicoccus sp.]